MFHGVVIDQQFEDVSFLEKLKVFAKKQDGNWGIYGVEVEDNEIDLVITLVQKNTKLGAWYGHFYDDKELIVVFKNMVFRVTPNKASWASIVEYGRTLGIPEEQLTFWPNRFQDEEHYFAKTDFV